jgi:hypothetical protein
LKAEEELAEAFRKAEKLRLREEAERLTSKHEANLAEAERLAKEDRRKEMEEGERLTLEQETLHREKSLIKQLEIEETANETMKECIRVGADNHVQRKLFVAREVTVIMAKEAVEEVLKLGLLSVTSKILEVLETDRIKASEVAEEEKMLISEALKLEALRLEALALEEVEKLRIERERLEEEQRRIKEKERLLNEAEEGNVQVRYWHYLIIISS